VAEILGVLVLVVLFGPSDPNHAQAFAEKLGGWVGPISGFVFCFLGALWVTKRLANDQVANGLVLGLAAAAFDIGILIAIGASLQPVVAVANVGRVIAGTIGGWVASQGRRETIEHSSESHKAK
jgi:hypothetical protein